MSILVFVEGSDGELKKSSKEAVSYALEAGKSSGDSEIVAVVFGNYDQQELENLGTNGAGKVIHIHDE